MRQGMAVQVTGWHGRVHKAWPVLARHQGVSVLDAKRAMAGLDEVARMRTTEREFRVAVGVCSLSQPMRNRRTRRRHPCVDLHKRRPRRWLQAGHVALRVRRAATYVMILHVFHFLKSGVTSSAP